MNDDFPKAGIKISYVTGEFIELLGGIDAIKGLTTEQVCQQIIKPKTYNDQSSYCDMLKKQGHPAYTETADAFVSHAHSYLFEDFLSALQWRLRDEPNASLWIDLFSINQHAPMDWTFDWLSTTFKTNVANIGRTIMIMSPWNNPLPYTRAWCVFEAFCTVDADGQFEIAMSKSDEGIFLQDIQEDPQGKINEMLGTIRAENSQCSVASDKRSIFHIIRNTVGFARLDAMVFERYRTWVIDVAQRAASRATSTKDSKKRLRLHGAAGMLYLGQGEYELAEIFGRMYLTESRELLGEDHPETLRAMETLAMILDGGGRHEAAENLYMQCLIKKKAFLGDDHPDTLLTMSHLAVTLENQRKYSAAEKQYKYCFERQYVILGGSNPQTLSTMYNLSASYSRQKRYRDAEELARFCLKHRKNVLGSDHPDTLKAMMNLAIILQNVGGKSEAGHLYRVYMEKQKSILGNSHPEIERMKQKFYHALQYQEAAHEDFFPIHGGSFGDTDTTIGSNNSITGRDDVPTHPAEDSDGNYFGGGVRLPPDRMSFSGNNKTENETDEQITDPYGEMGLYAFVLNRLAGMPDGMGRLEFQHWQRDT